ncbi:hypothetical protein F4777DRAFT_582097 [Nemania sp. FL0916]|nr:hypothetical protein F4777DRAFT_582097 [Nemania sp. FL0916]
MSNVHVGIRILKNGIEKRDLHDNGNQHEHSDASDHSGDGIQWWVILIIVYLAILLLVFSLSLIYYWKCENKRCEDGHRFRKGHVFWKAFTVATGLWIWSWVFQKHGWCGSTRKIDHAERGGPYTQIDARLDTRRHAAIRSDTSPAPNSRSARAMRPNTLVRLDASANQKSAYVPLGQSNSLLKAPGYMPTQTSKHPESIPMATLNPSPNPSPKYAPPPPYIHSPPPAELDGQSIQPQYPSRIH